MNRLFCLIFSSLILTSCTWTMVEEKGQTKIKPKYPVGTAVYYEDGTYNKDQRFNQYRKVEHAIIPEKKVSPEVETETVTEVIIEE